MYWKSRHIFYYETPTDTSVAGGGSGEPTPTPAVQPPGQGSDGFWDLFPNVPEEQRPLVEPHIREMQGHVTRVEQQLAPFKPLLEAGYTADQASGLVQFSQQFDAQPLDMWVQMGQMLQESGVVANDVDLEYLAAIARGEDPEADGQPGTLPDPASVTPDEQTEVAALRARLEELESARLQEQTQREQHLNTQLYERNVARLKEALQQSGFPEDTLKDDKLINAHIIAAQGDFEAARTSLLNLRSGVLKGFVKKQEPNELELPNGVPDTPMARPPERDGAWGKARTQAASRLRRDNNARVQG